MMMLLDWSGSMSDVLFDTVKQLINLVEFCRKVNNLMKFTSLQVKENMKIDMMKMVMRKPSHSWSHNKGEFYLKTLT